jgi:LysW-gamma-L-lysine carboxypeptidase
MRTEFAQTMVMAAPLHPLNASSIDDAEAERLLRGLVATPSPSRRETPAAQMLVGWMAEHGYDQAYIDAAGSAVGIIGQGSRQIVLLGHIDTFDGFPTVRREGRLLYGRGTVDAKGPLCAFAVAAARAYLPPDTQVVVIGAVEEEAASSAGARHALTQFSPAMCLIGEPSRWDRVTLGYKGRLVLHYTWRGALGHSAGQTASPAEHAVAYWLRARAFTDAYNQGREAIFERLDATLQDLNTGQDGAYGWATATIGFRLPPGLDPAQIAAALALHDDDAGAELTTTGAEIAFVGEKDSAPARALRGAIREAGGVPRFVHKTGTSDMNVVGPAWACPILAYGPGDSALDHTPDEHIDLDEYLAAIRVLTAALERM